jgi:hypothetical protein
MAQMNQLEKFIKLLFSNCDIRDYNEDSVLYREDSQQYSFFIHMPQDKGENKEHIGDIHFRLSIHNENHTQISEKTFIIPTSVMPNVFPLILNGINARLNLKFNQNHTDYPAILKYCLNVVDCLQNDKNIVELSSQFKPCHIEHDQHETRMVFSSYEKLDNNDLKEVKHKIYFPRHEQNRYFFSMVAELIYDFEAAHSSANNHGQNCMTLLLPNHYSQSTLPFQSHQMIENNVAQTTLFDYNLNAEFDDNLMHEKALELYECLKDIPLLSKEALMIHLEDTLPENPLTDNTRKLKI